MDILPPKNKKHRKSKNSQKSKVKPSNGKNVKAFNVSNIGRTKKLQQRNLDRLQKKEVVPQTNRLDEDLPPPITIVIMGPKGVGKSTLIRSLVKLFTKQNVIDPNGPITIIGGKRKRFTFMECPQDIYSMCDLAKVADVVLLLIDASYGFEMETFEFLNQLQLHGFPKVIGVMTHLDGFIHRNKLLQNTKKAIKHRFWTEIYKGAKILEMSGVVNGKYLKHEVKRLSLVLMRTKLRPLVWRNSHPYVLVDRVEDVTVDPSRGETNPLREVTFFGYVRGTNLKPSTMMHLIGAGDFEISSISVLDDPCPLPAAAGAVKTSLKAKETLLYAPMANVGRVSLDKDGMYIDLKNVHYTKKENLQLGDGQADASEEVTAMDAETPIGMLRRMQDVKRGFDELIDDAEMSMFPGQRGVKSGEVQAELLDDYDDDQVDDDQSEDNEADQEGDDEEDVDDDEDDEDEEEVVDEEEEDDDDDEVVMEESGNEDARWKKDMKVKAADAFYSRLRNSGSDDIMTRVYGKSWLSHLPVTDVEDSAAAEDTDDDDENFFKVKRGGASGFGPSVDDVDSTRVRGPSKRLEDRLDDVIDSLASRLVHHARICREGQKGLNLPIEGEDDEGGDIDDEEVDGSFEDLETGEVHGPSADESGDDSEADNDDIDRRLREAHAKMKASKASATSSFLAAAEEDDDDEDDDVNKEGGSSLDKKTKTKRKGEDAEEEKLLDAARKLQQELRLRSKAEFGADGPQSRVALEGHRQGLYVRIKITDVPLEFCQNFSTKLPVILGGLQPMEMNLGVVRARVKRHRWHRKILKSNDPLIFSIGWRRFQSIPVYCIEDVNERNRYLKYTPEHMHCISYFYGPLIPPNTPLLAFQRASSLTADFRICLTGTALEVESTPSVVKKLKLVGYPMKIFKNTAFIRGMFNSSLEVAKFEGAKIKTVSGIRGQIKRGLNDGDKGTFRATFEDKILMSDIVTCRLWVPVEVKRFYNPVLSLLTSDPTTWQGLRTIAQIRRDEQIPIQVNKDSVYKPIQRVRREFSKLHIPKKLEAALPFESKPKNERPLNRDSYMAKRAVILEPEDRKKRAVIQMLSGIRTDKEAKRKLANQLRLKKKIAETEKRNEQFEPIKREEKKRKFREKGLAEAAKKQRVV